MAAITRSKLTIFGKVTNRQNHPLAGLLVQAFDKDMRSEELLGAATTERNGQYLISYAQEKFARAEKNSADILMKVFGPGGRTLLYEDSLESVRFNSAELEEIDICINHNVSIASNEFDHMLREIKPLIGTILPADLQETDKNRDISFLSSETSIAQEKLEYLVVAHQMARESKTNPAFYYALLRKGTLLKANFSQLSHLRISIGVSSEIQPLVYEVALTDPQIIYTDVEAAVNDLIVPESALQDGKKIVKTLSRYAKDAERYYNEEYPKKMVNLLSQFLLSEKIPSFAEEWVKSGYDFQTFTKKIFSDDFFKTSSDAVSAKTALTLGEMLGYDREIVSAISAAKGIKKTGGYQKTRVHEQSRMARSPDRFRRKNQVVGRAVKPGSGRLSCLNSYAFSGKAVPVCCLPGAAQPGSKTFFELS
ncbi:MAG: hypothetical protein ACJ75B_06725 [Flavisolibacter sp.]